MTTQRSNLRHGPVGEARRATQREPGPTPTEATSQADPRSVLRDYIVRHGLKASRQRDAIVAVFFGLGSHVSAEELLRAVRLRFPRVGHATIYRAMRLLCASGVAQARHFGDGQTRYEPADSRSGHHDHLICTACGRIVEFVDPEIERLQNRVARERTFEVSYHRLELYGRCLACQKAE